VQADHVVETPWGPIPVWGNIKSFTPLRPLLFVIRGAFSIPDHMVSMATRLPAPKCVALRTDLEEARGNERSNLQEIGVRFAQIGKCSSHQQRSNRACASSLASHGQ
jgi:hypothetical protein